MLSTFSSEKKEVKGAEARINSRAHALSEPRHQDQEWFSNLQRHQNGLGHTHFARSSSDVCTHDHGLAVRWVGAMSRCISNKFPGNAG